ncbi:MULTISPECIES: NAD(P)H-dependent glycerol-3-phosphate dehydrogenase [unclassified Actinomyces]|uniref:NAD(P)H-dependent glycerol-3-phosphate dehydrogenase n=1 Tax=unclassified Actinomyces TaxID=2609248 RepID=UPI002017FAE8|nr:MULTISPECIES: NAD(P)H-dependent glycerol-3-phosphate dehydrogenase [unclassified Actinomyces]MCL3776672.1 NAD(P)-dependent glycerol-3-phosphate dehydrogenase [Actinomyces sp. AC-20-1]MCL3789809.1 NAD(P)-dependent glycerol-3-phosphate dehydrogenase [Actinomyces sp. 187325]MCL3792386.1 NAD(P)-dependent glycerol-3-phosphate dehydrogenase [Actinomyces sp. 186855]MCL3794596.1 NAD(P)-dependent glycerol-3-phosphate dehydrogenase [Actinomyces sp. 217892]
MTSTTPRPFARAAVIGSGAWGTTFAALLAEAGTPTTVWARRPQVAEEISSGRNERYLPGVSLPGLVGATTDLGEAVDGAGLVVVAVPSQSARQVLTPLTGRLADGAAAVSLMKGIELGTGLRMSEVLGQALGLGPERLAVVSGPNLADEIAAGQPTATVVAAQDEDLAAAVAASCATSTFRPYTNTDVLGVELCGAVKNVIALAVGIAAGRGLGDNSKATLITRGLVEITRLGLALGARPETFSGLAGMGDLVATCSSPLSRNQSFGRHLGQGMTAEQASAASRGVAEGARSARAVLDLAASHGVEMPITEGVVAVVEGRATTEEVTDALLARPRKAEGVNAAPLG